MYRLNANITEEAAEILKDRAKRLGAPMGVVLTMLLLEIREKEIALSGMAMFKAETEKQSKQGQI